MPPLNVSLFGDVLNKILFGPFQETIVFLNPTTWSILNVSGMAQAPLIYTSRGECLLASISNSFFIKGYRFKTINIHLTIESN